MVGTIAGARGGDVFQMPNDPRELLGQVFRARGRPTPKSRAQIIRCQTPGETGRVSSLYTWTPPGNGTSK